MSSPPVDPWQVGETIEGLYAVREVFQGGMGLVYRVCHTGWNVDLAMKCPRPDWWEHEDAAGTFERECDVWINLGLHPHVATCHYVRRINHLPCIFAEFVDGGSLRDWILSRDLYRGGEHQALARILDVAIQFAWGLDFAHGHQLVHQDVKPGNVLLTRDGTAKVTDFGLAKVGRTQPHAAQTPLFVSAGGLTPAYCSPEQKAGAPLTIKTDIWSWAVSVLEMFTGGICWESGVVAKATLEEFCAHDFQMRSLPAMPRPLFDLLRFCFRSKPENRPANFQEISNRLREIYAEVHDEAYWREPPDAEFLAADALNNRAVSLLDVGRERDAMELFARALEADPLHPEATFNRGLVFLRKGRLAEEAFLSQLNRVCQADAANWLPKYLFAQVSAELGRREVALRALDKTEGQADDSAAALIDRFRQSLQPENASQKSGDSRQQFALAFPRSGAEHSRNAVKMKRLLEKARTAQTDKRTDDAIRYVARIRELPGFARHPDVQRLARALEMASDSEGASD